MFVSYHPFSLILKFPHFGKAKGFGLQMRKKNLQKLNSHSFEFISFARMHNNEMMAAAYTNNKPANGKGKKNQTHEQTIRKSSCFVPG